MANGSFDFDRATADRLRAEIARHNDLYYNRAAPEIADDEYDRLLDELAGIEARHPDWDVADSPTRRVGAAPPAATKRGALPPHRHAVPMLSIPNTYSDEEIRKFAGRVDGALRDAGVGGRAVYTVELKIDGVAFAALYRGGRFVLGATRGDGSTGENVTAAMRAIRALPKTLSGPDVPGGEVEVRGEIYLPRRVFAELVREQEESGSGRVFANPRNAAAGSLKLLDPELVAARGLECVFYQIIDAGEHGVSGQAEALARLEGWGLPVNPLRAVAIDADAVIAFRDRVGRDRRDLPYDTDGLVVKVDAFAHQEALGLGSRSPNWAIAYKFAPERVETTVEGIRVQVGKFGRLTPVADLAPVLLSGSTVTHASLHNESHIARKDIRVGDRVLVEKAGEIIPQIGEAVRDKRPPGAEPYVMPAACPVCGQASTTTENEGPDGRAVVLRFCPNPACPAKLLARVVHFASRDAMDIEGLGPAAAEWLLSRGLVRDVADIYGLDHARLLPMTKAGREILGGADAETEATKSAGNLVDAIAASKGRGLARLLFALSIPDVGETAAQILARRFKTLDALREATEETVGATPMGESTAYRTLGDKAAAALGAALDKAARDRPFGEDPAALALFLEGLDLPGFGGKRVQAVARRFGDIGSLLRADRRELSLVEMGASQVKRTLGPVAAASLRIFFDDPGNRSLLDRLRAAGVSFAVAGGGTGAAGKVFVLTGTLPNLGRAEARRLIEAAGGLVTGTVGRKVDYLVAGASPGGKLDKANGFGVDVIDEAALRRLCGG